MLKERLWHDEEKGEIYLNEVSMHAWRRGSPHKIQREFEGIIGPASRIIITEATKKVMREVFAWLADKYAALEKENTTKFAVKLLSELPRYGYGVPEATLIDERHGYAKIKVTNSFNTTGYEKTDETVCHIMEGILASLFERVFKRKTVCREMKCSAMGNPYCEFVVTSFNIPVKPVKRHRKPKGRLAPVIVDFSPEKGEVIHNKINIILIPRDAYSTLQQKSERIMGRGAKRISYLIGRAAGSYFGRNFLKIKLISLIVKMNKTKALSKMAEFASRSGTGRFEFEQKKGWLMVRLHNSFNAYGSKKSKEPVCHIAAGLISGVCDLVFGKRVHTEEVKCIAKGDPYCEFQVKPEKE